MVAEAGGSSARGRTAFPLLLDSGSYRSQTWRYDVPDVSRGEPGAWPALVPHWVSIFAASVPSFALQAEREAMEAHGWSADKASEAGRGFAKRYADVLRGFTDGKVKGMSAVHGRVTCAKLCRLRDACLLDSGFDFDCFGGVKRRETREALGHLPGWLQRLDAEADPVKKLEMTIRGCFAGNIFDLGAAQSATLFSKGGASFEATLETLQTRPWAVDNFDLFARKACERRWGKALVFVDNAGSDVVLGMVPLARFLLGDLGVRDVVLVGNAAPTINDMTYGDMCAQLLTEESLGFDEVLSSALKEKRLRAVSSGSALPVIDLSDVSVDLADECEGVDLVVLDGMGRSIESNLGANFRVDCLKIGMIKHREVARCLGGKLYDCSLSFCEAGSKLAVVDPVQVPARLRLSVSSPVYDQDRGRLYWLDMAREPVVCVTDVLAPPESKHRTVTFALPAYAAALCLGLDGRLMGIVGRSLCEIRIPQEGQGPEEEGTMAECVELVDVAHGGPFLTGGHAATHFTQQGTWLSPACGAVHPSGEWLWVYVTSTRDVVRVSLLSGVAEVAIPSARLPEAVDLVAVAFDVAGAEVLLADAGGKCIASYRLDLSDGRALLDSGRLLLSLSELGSKATPVGLGIDAKSNLYCALEDGSMVCVNLKAPPPAKIPVFEPPEPLDEENYVASGVFFYSRSGSHWQGGRQTNGCIGITLHARGQQGQGASDERYAAWGSRVVTVAEGVPAGPAPRLKAP